MVKKNNADIRRNILMDGGVFNELIPAHSVKSSLSYLMICLILTFLLASLLLFYFYYEIDGGPMMLALNYALIDALYGVGVIAGGFLLLQVLPTHAAARVLGAKRNLEKTFQVHVYAYTPYFLLGWVWTFGSMEGTMLEQGMLGIGLVFTIFAVINGVNGLKSIHKLSTIKAFAAEFIVPLLVYVLLVVGYMVALDAGML
jgi:hypothetical protein